MLRVIAASFYITLGVLLGAVGLPLAVWVTLSLYQPEEATRWAVWALELATLSQGTAEQLAGYAIRRNALIALGIASAVLCAMALAALFSARAALKRGAMSHDGLGTLELATRSLRAGRPVAGTIWLNGDIDRGEEVQVELSCKRSHGSGRDETIETAFWDLLKVPAVESRTGFSVPFRFNVPPIAPPSGAGYQWRLAFNRSRFPYSFPSVFPLKLGAAPAAELRVFERNEAPGRMDPIDEYADSYEPPAATRQPPVVTDTPDTRRRTPVVTEPPSVDRRPSLDIDLSVVDHQHPVAARVAAGGQPQPAASRHTPVAASAPTVGRQPAVTGTARVEAILRNAQNRHQPPPAVGSPVVNRGATAPGAANRGYTAPGGRDLRHQARSTRDSSESVAHQQTPDARREAPDVIDFPGVSPQQPALRQPPPAARPQAPVANNSVGRQTHRLNGEERWGSVITDDGRKEPVFRATADFEDYTPSHLEAPESSGMRGFLKWLLILLFGVPVGVATIAFATVAVLYYVK